MATYLVTGANRGIGYEYRRQLQTRGDTVIAVCRTATEELKTLGVRKEGDELINKTIIFSLWVSSQRCKVSGSRGKARKIRATLF